MCHLCDQKQLPLFAERRRQPQPQKQHIPLLLPLFLFLLTNAIVGGVNAEQYNVRIYQQQQQQQYKNAAASSNVNNYAPPSNDGQQQQQWMGVQGGGGAESFQQSQMAQQQKQPDNGSVLSSSTGIGISGSGTLPAECQQPPALCNLEAAAGQFDPQLAGGIRGTLGIKARLNPLAFRYLSSVSMGVLTYMVKRTQLPAISQCIPQANGCLNVRNLHLQGYRCPQNIHIDPAPPNQIVINVQNVDVDVAGDLGGQITIMYALALYGIVHVSAQQVNIRVGVAIAASADGGPQLRMLSCSASVGRVQVSIENGGLLGDIANQQLQHKISRIVRQQISKQLCRRLPSIIDQQVNAKLRERIPRLISLTDLIPIAVEALGLDELLLGGGSEGETSRGNGTTTMATETTTMEGNSLRRARALSLSKHAVPMPNMEEQRKKAVIAISSTSNHQHGRRQANASDASAAAIRTENNTVGTAADGSTTMAPFSEETTTTAASSSLSFLTVILTNLNMSKLDNIFLNVQMASTTATSTDYNIGLSGEFSQCGHGCTPFGAFPLQFPTSGGKKMAEILISDFSINSLLYHLHRVGFLRLRVGPDTPTIGPLLKTTCEEEGSGDEFLEDHGVESENGTILALAIMRQRKRHRRQDLGTLASLGICLGFLLPAVREQHPKQKAYIIISSVRAPSVQLSTGNGTNDGLATVDFLLNADFHIEATKELVGTMQISATLELAITPEGNLIKGHAEITRLELKDVGNKMGLTQDALDSLGNIGKEILLKPVNDALEKGRPLKVPENLADLPINIVNPELHFLRHALLVQTDFSLKEEALGGSEPC